MKSISLIEDRNSPLAIKHYKPTLSSQEVIESITGWRGSCTTHVVAPYGTGKSFAALVALTLLSGSKKNKKQLFECLGKDSNLANDQVLRRGKSKNLVLSGHCPDLVEELCQQAGITRQPNLQSALISILKAHKNCDRLAIVWDEFGHHLQTLSRHHNEEDLIFVQELAEWAVRRKSPVVTFTTLMHKKFGDYNRSKSLKAINAWKKVEGRFDTIRLETDTLSQLELIADLINHKKDRLSNIKNYTKRVKSAGFFNNIEDRVLGNVLERSAPLTPAALDTLIKLGSNVAQNERTISHFIQDRIVSRQETNPVGLWDLYEYFAPMLASDISTGGTYRRFLEAETTLSKADCEISREIIKSIALLQIGRETSAVKLAKKKLIDSVCLGTSRSVKQTREAIENLIKIGLIFHIKQIDDIRFWHGTDHDISSAIAEEVDKYSSHFNLIKSLEGLHPPEPQFSAQYNFENAITRYALPKYANCANLQDIRWVNQQAEIHKDEDAVMFLLLDSDIQSLDLETIPKEFPSHFLIAVPHEPLDLAPHVLEIKAIERLQSRSDLVNKDPLFLEALKLHKAVISKFLSTELDQIQNPDLGQVSWIWKGKIYRFGTENTPDDVLSDVFRIRYPSTPIIRNEQVVRRIASGSTLSAVKRCCLAILEHSGQPELGYHGSTSADASLFRTVFARTGLYVSTEQGGKWVTPDEVKEDNLRRVWNEISQFFTQKKKHPVFFAELVQTLKNPPYGIRQGLYPLLIASGLRAFGQSIAIYRKNGSYLTYLDDIQPTSILAICNNPGDYSLHVTSLTSSQTQNLAALVDIVSKHRDAQENDLFRAFYDGLYEWKKDLPFLALEADGLSSETKKLQPYLRDPNFDPFDFFLNQYPAAIGGRILTKRCVEKFKTALTEIEGTKHQINDWAINETQRQFNQHLAGESKSLLDAAETWARMIACSNQSLSGFGQIEKGILNRSKNASKFLNGELGFVSAISTILIGKIPEQWIAEDKKHFAVELHKVLNSIGSSILSQNNAAPVAFIKNHIAILFEGLSKSMGSTQLKEIIDDIYKESSRL